MRSLCIQNYFVLHNCSHILFAISCWFLLHSDKNIQFYLYLNQTVFVVGCFKDIKVINFWLLKILQESIFRSLIQYTQYS